MWYDRLSEYLLKKWYRNDPICPCIYVKILKNEFAIIIIYVDETNIMRTLIEFTKTIDWLKKKFEMKDL